eukprot:2413839-Pyramimonas_sp.AAC.1
MRRVEENLGPAALAAAACLFLRQYDYIYDLRVHDCGARVWNVAFALGGIVLAPSKRLNRAPLHV